MKSITTAIVLVSLFAFSVANACYSQGDSTPGWTRFRGPNGTGLVADAKLPLSWSDHDYLWRVKLLGSGSGSPVVWNDRIFVNSCDASTAKIFVECRNTKNGNLIWKKPYESANYRMHSRNSYASTTPAVDADHVYVTFANPEHTFLAALDHDGTEIWKVDFGRWIGAHGFAVSPIIVGEMVILANSQQADKLSNNETPGISRVIAVDRKTGEQKWSTELATTIASYSVPCILSKTGQADQIIGCSNAEGFYSLRPADGEINWRHHAFKLRTVSSPLLAEGLLIGSCGSGGGGNTLVAINPEAGSKVFEVNQNASYVPCPFAVNGLLFMCSDKGVVSCLDLHSGESHWRQRVSTGFSSSPVGNSSHLYCVDESGDVAVIEARKEFKLVATNPLNESSRATPAIVGNALVFRTETHLMAVGTFGE